MRKVFDASLDWRELLVDVQGLPPDAPQVRAAMRQKLADYGCVILNGEAWDEPAQMQLRLEAVFGAVGQHNRANRDGVVTITPLEGYEDYLGASSFEHPLHTDGPFEAVQPRIMSLLCDRQAEVGGETTLVSSKALYLHVLAQEPESLKALFDDDAMYIERADQAATVPVFQRVGERIFLAFRYDGVVDVRIKTAGQAAFAAILAYLQDPAHVVQFVLPSKHLLIADNGAVLHGRRAFPAGEQRRMLRLNLNGGADATMDEVLGFAASLP